MWTWGRLGWPGFPLWDRPACRRRLSPPFPSRVGRRSFPAQSPAPSPEILQPVPRPWPCPSALPLRLGEGPSAPCRRPPALPAGCPGHLRQSGAARSRAGCGGCGPGTESGAGVAGGGAPSAASRAQAWRLSLCIPQQGRSPGPSPHRHPRCGCLHSSGPRALPAQAAVSGEVTGNPCQMPEVGAGQTGVKPSRAELPGAAGLSPSAEESAGGSRPGPCGRPAGAVQLRTGTGPSSQLLLVTLLPASGSSPHPACRLPPRACFEAFWGRPWARLGS